MRTLKRLLKVPVLILAGLLAFGAGPAQAGLTTAVWTEVSVDLGLGSPVDIGIIVLGDFNSSDYTEQEVQNQKALVGSLPTLIAGLNLEGTSVTVKGSFGPKDLTGSLAPFKNANTAHNFLLKNAQSLGVVFYVRVFASKVDPPNVPGTDMVQTLHRYDIVLYEVTGAQTPVYFGSIEVTDELVQLANEFELGDVLL